MRVRKLLLLMALAGVISMAPGCSSQTTSTTTTRSSTAENPDYAAGEANPAPPPQQTTTTTTTSSEPDSVLGAAAHLVGTIILLPFRIIGLVV